ncbi:MAG: F0F1 ATP synthase subunit A [Elusimicrobiales bacterium]
MELREILEEHILDHIYGWLNLIGFHLPFSKHLLMMIIVSFILFIVFPLIINSKSPLLKPLRVIIEVIVIFIRDNIVKPNLGEDKLSYTAYFATLFFFILLMNLFGFLPYGATATGNISVTLGLSLTTFLLINYSGIKKHGFFHYFKSFIPHNIPVLLYPIIFPIEIIGLFTKTLALAIRLFANMIAGHFVMLVFISFIFIFGAINLYLGLFIVSPIVVLMVLFVSLLEVLVAFLQAYIFTFLTAIFTSQATSSH